MKNRRRSLLPGQAARKAVLADYKKRAETKGLSWNLSEEQFDKLTSGKCNYCGKEPSQTRVNRGKNGSFTYNGIDRVDNSRGYELSNVVSCCKICNRAKDVMSITEFIEWAKRVVTYAS